MAVTLGGIAWVVMERQPGEAGAGPAEATRPPTTAGVGLAVLGAVGQAVGLVLSKLGMKGYDPFASTQIRILAGLAGFAALYTAIGFWPRFRAACRDRVALRQAAFGAVLGPFLGVSMSLIAVQRTHAGVAASIMATTPLLVIPLAAWIDREKIRWPDLAGAVLAIAGVALLFQGP